MIYYVLDNQMNVLNLIDTESSCGVVMTDVKITYGIYNNVRLYTMEANVNKVYEDEQSAIDSQNLQVGNSIMFENSFGEVVILAIRLTPNENKIQRSIYCEDLSMDMLGKKAFVYPAHAPQTISYYLNRELYGTGWEIGINELLSAKRLIEFQSSETILDRIKSIAQSFNCEISFSLEMKNNRISKKLVNIRFALGRDRSDVVLRDGYDITTINKSLDATDIKTAIIVPGIENITYDDGQFFSLLGEQTICDRVANSRWGTARTAKELNTSWLYDELEGDYETPQDAFTAGMAQLKTKNVPRAEYQTQAIYDDADFDAGDYVTIDDEDFNPPLRIKTRVIEKTYDPDDISKNEFIQSNNTELKNGVNSQFTTFQQQLNNAKEENVSVEIKQSNDENNRILTCSVIQNGKDITSTIKENQFIWTKFDKDGNRDLTFGTSFGREVKDSLNNVTREAVYECRVIYFKNRYVTVRYFIDGLIDLASRVERARTDESIVIPFITDTHFSRQTILNDTIEFLLRSEGHFKNVVDFTYAIDCDVVVGGGDFVDGTTVKSATLSDLESIRSLFSLCKCPYILARGNHDDNSSADTRYGDFLSNMVLPSELYEYIVRPSLSFGIVENPTDRNMYYYYDVPDKNFRIIVLNNFDIPYTIDADGRTKYRANKIGAYRNNQINWFAQTLKNTPSNYQVMLFEHSSLGKGMYEEYNFSKNYDLIEGVIKAYMTGTSFSKTNTEIDFKASVSVTFERPGTIVCMANGHHHKDRIKKNNGIWNVNVVCSLANPGYDDPTRPIGKLEEDAWDVFVVYPSKRKVKIFRFGAGEDREFTY
ncbi:MAG: phage tail protein [Vagococcus sp.]